MKMKKINDILRSVAMGEMLTDEDRLAVASYIEMEDYRAQERRNFLKLRRISKNAGLMREIVDILSQNATTPLTATEIQLLMPSSKAQGVSTSKVVSMLKDLAEDGAVRRGRGRMCDYPYHNFSTVRTIWVIADSPIDFSPNYRGAYCNDREGFWNNIMG